MRRAAIFLALLGAGPQDAGPAPDFVRDVRPILSAHCLKCHGPEKAKARFRLDSRSAALKGGLSGKAILPGRGDESLLIRLLVEEDAEARMPQKAPALAPRDIEVLRRWIDRGAAWPDSAAGEAGTPIHWAYVRPARPPLPTVHDAAWVRNSVDAFVLARLDKEGLKPSPEATREKLLRRLSLDLTGLPPGIEDLDGFLGDPAADAYEKAVDRLLASPHFGERWARPWLDLARYADSNGFEKDAPRSMWPWREWVIEALNRDTPFTQFTVEQIAGDLIPGATRSQRIATGFHRNTMLNEEDGVDREEARWNTLVERAATTAAAWLGTTLACAQCHHHKYDPFSQQDFYRLLAFFDNAEEPVVEIATPDQEEKRRVLAAELARLEEDLRRPTPDFDRWEAEQRRVLSAWAVLEAGEAGSASGARLIRQEDGSILAEGPSAENDVYTVVVRTSLKGITAFRLEVLPDPSLPRGGPGCAPSGDFVLSELRVFAAPGDDPSRLRPVGLHRPTAEFASKYAWIPLVLDGDPETGWAVAPRVGLPHRAHVETREPVGEGGDTILTFVLEQRSRHPRHTIGRFRLGALAVDHPTPTLQLPESARVLLERPAESLTPAERETLRAHYAALAPDLEPARRRLAEVRKEIGALGIAAAWVLAERPGTAHPATRLRHRGNFLLRRETVPAGVPAALPPLPAGAPPNRLGLARWLASEENPLTARVAVNRLWEQVFGRGIVETSEDFGTQGSPPSHPELLDWLAVEFVRNGWSTKSLLRAIVTSAAYRQSSRVTPELLEKDPQNRLLARGPSFRMEAEMIRDVALAAGGLLSRKIGGPSVYPPQPEGTWNVADSKATWVASPGPDRHRRGIYTFWRRSAPYPSFAVFDAPSREFCAARRSRTTTPLQALVLLNDPAFFEAAQGLARLMAREGLAWGFRACTARAPRPDELAILRGLYERERERSGEEAALTLVASTLLNLDETIVKD